MSSTSYSPDGAWYWDGRQWLPAGAAAPPLPSLLGRQGGSHWDGRELLVRCTRRPFVASAVIMPLAILLDLACLVLLATLVAGLSGGEVAWIMVFLGVMELGIAGLIGCWLYLLSAAIRPPTVHFSARGILARAPWRGSFYIPWDAVVGVGAHRAGRPLLTVEVSEEFWAYLGRRWMQRWASPFAFGAPPRRASMIMIPPRGTGMEMADILRCVRQVAPARIPALRV